MLLSHVGAKERPYIHSKYVSTYICTRTMAARTYTNPREKPEPPPISRRSARAPPRVNKLTRFIPFFHRRSRYIFPPSAVPGILRTAHTCPGNREIRPSGVSVSPPQLAKYHRPASVRKHSEFSQTEFPFCDAGTLLKSRR